MRKIKAKPPTIPKGAPIIYVGSLVQYYGIRQRQFEEYKKAQAASEWAEGLKVFQKRFGVIES